MVEIFGDVDGNGEGDGNDASSHLLLCTDHTNLRARAINFVLRMEAP